MVSLVFNVPLSFFARKMSACIYPWPPCLQQWLFWIFIFKLAASHYYTLKSSPRPFLPIFDSFSRWWALFSMSHCLFLQEKWVPAFFPGPPVYSNDYSEFLSSNLPPLIIILWNPPQDPSSPSLILLVDGEPCFQCPTVFFCKKNECLHLSLAPLFTAMIILNFYLQTCRLSLLYFEILPKTLPPHLWFF